jgi:hypothetical protein
MTKHPLIVLAGLLTAAMPALADDVECRDRSIGTRVIDGNLIVPAASSCTLNGTTVLGTVQVLDDAQILIRRSATVIGNVQSEGGARVRIRNSEVGGDVQLTNLDSGLESLVISSHVGGTVDWYDNSSPFLIRYSDVDSDVKVTQNSARARIFDNTIGGNLQCQSNIPRPLGGNNVVDGSKENQCSSF